MFFQKFFLTLLALVLLLGSSVASAQTVRNNAGSTSQVGQSSNSSRIVFVKEKMHAVIPGDNAWNISQDLWYDGFLWRDLVAQNPFLWNRVYQDTAFPYWSYVIMRDGEQLLTYQITHPEVQIIDSAVNDTVHVPFNPPTKPVLPPTANAGAVDFWSILIGLLTVLAIVALIVYAGRKWTKKNVITSGPPQVYGGINDESALGVMSQRSPRAQIISIRKGKFYGRGTPHYNFSAFSVNNFLNSLFGKNFSGEAGYEAVALLPGGERRTVYCLEACGNDVREGNFLTGITFIPDTEQPDSFTELNRTAPPVTPVVPDAQSEAKAEKPEVKTEVVPVKTDAMLMAEFLKDLISKDTKIYIELNIGENKLKFNSTGLGKKEEEKK